MDKPNVIIEATPETNAVSEQTTPTGVEATPIAETIPVSPAAPPVSSLDTNQGSIPDPGSFVPTQDDDSVTPEELADLTSGSVLPADDNWVHKVRQVIKDDSGQPYKEEEDAEKLNEEYMKDRFNVDVDAPTEEKN